MPLSTSGEFYSSHHYLRMRILIGRFLHLRNDFSDRVVEHFYLTIYCHRARTIDNPDEVERASRYWATRASFHNQSILTSVHHHHEKMVVNPLQIRIDRLVCTVK